MNKSSTNRRPKNFIAFPFISELDLPEIFYKDWASHLEKLAEEQDLPMYFYTDSDITFPFLGFDATVICAKESLSIHLQLCNFHAIKLV